MIKNLFIMKTLQSLIFLISIYGYSQPSKNYYDYNSDYSKDRREAQKNLEKQADVNRQPNSSSNKRSTNTPNSNDNSWGDYSQVRRQNEAEARADAAAASFDDKISRMESFIKKRNLAKSRENYKAIYNCALDAGFNEYQAGRILGFSADDYQNMLDRERGSTQETTPKETTPQYSNNSSNDPNVNGNFTGYGAKNYSDGTIYIGNLVSGVQNGYGKKITSEGTFEGNFINNQLQGKGTLKLKNGAIYDGEFVNDALQGKGEFINSSGETYLGDFVQGRLTGFGAYWFNDGSMYFGDFLNDKFHGEGKYYKKNKFLMSGIFKDGNGVNVKYYNNLNKEVSKKEFDNSK